jgi:5'-nucleotidase
MELNGTDVCTVRILLTNDDGILATGIRELRRVLERMGDVTMVAPASEQSAVGHSITLMNPLLVREVHEEGKPVGYAVEGKPADCVKLGLVQLLDKPPHLVVSGINAGSNAGINVLYSGTVAAAIEGAFFDVTSIAVSLTQPEDTHYAQAADIAGDVIEQILAQRPRAGELFNINIPDLSKGPPRGIRVARQALTCYRESYEARRDPRGRLYYWLLADPLMADGDLDADMTALSHHYVTVTPLHFDLTDRDRLARMKSWDWSTAGWIGGQETRS